MSRFIILIAFLHTRSSLQFQHKGTKEILSLQLYDRRNWFDRLSEEKSFAANGPFNRWNWTKLLSVNRVIKHAKLRKISLGRNPKTIFNYLLEYSQTDSLHLELFHWRVGSIYNASVLHRMKFSQWNLPCKCTERVVYVEFLLVSCYLEWNVFYNTESAKNHVYHAFLSSCFYSLNKFQV